MLFPNLAKWVASPRCVKRPYMEENTATSLGTTTSRPDSLSMNCFDWSLTARPSCSTKETSSSAFSIQTSGRAARFLNCDDLRRDFAVQAAVKADFDADSLRQAHWYLQARITQHTDFSITTLDQSRDAAHRPPGPGRLNPLRACST